MNFEPLSWNVITVGAWNRAILTPEWIAKTIFRVPEGTPVPIEVALNVRIPWKVKHGDCAVVVGNNLEIIAEKYDYETLDKARKLSIIAMNELPKTPLVATGYNIRYRSEDDLDPELAQLAQCELDTLLCECDLDIESRNLRRSLVFEGGQINLSISLGKTETNVEFNLIGNVSKVIGLLSMICDVAHSQNSISDCSRSI